MASPLPLDEPSGFRPKKGRDSNSGSVDKEEPLSSLHLWRRPPNIAERSNAST